MWHFVEHPSGVPNIPALHVATNHRVPRDHVGDLRGRVKHAPHRRCIAERGVHREERVKNEDVGQEPAPGSLGVGLRARAREGGEPGRGFDQRREGEVIGEEVAPEEGGERGEGQARGGRRGGGADEQVVEESGGGGEEREVEAGAGEGGGEVGVRGKVGYDAAEVIRAPADLATLIFRVLKYIIIIHNIGTIPLLF